MPANTVMPKWDRLPLEIWAIVIGSITVPQDFRRCWFTCRQVSRAFRKATELAFQNRVVPHVSLSCCLIFQARMPVVRPRSEGFKAVDFVVEIMMFEKYSEGGSSVVLLDKPVHDYLHPPPEGWTPPITLLDNNEVVAMEKLILEEWKVLMNSYLSAGSRGRNGPFLYYTGFSFDPPKSVQVSVNFETAEVTIPWKTLISSLMAQEMKLAEEVKLEASMDVEKSRWHTSSSPSVEQGLRIALSSKVVRVERFRTCLRAAAKNFNKKRPGAHNSCQRFVEYGLKCWYNEWATYVGIQ
ncbi:hypothetical protein AAE478_005100 [Parahypoxylon ruwenzoriense]